MIMCMLVTSVHAKFGASTAKVERSKRPKCEVLNEGDLAHIQGIAVMKFVHNYIHYTVAYY